MSDDVHKKMSPQRYFLNVYLATIGRKRIHDFALPKAGNTITLSRLDGIVKDYVEKYGLLKYTDKM